MVPVRSEVPQPLLPSVSPIRLFPREAKVPTASGLVVLPVFTATMVLPMFTVLLASLPTPPPPVVAELALTVQLISVAMPACEDEPVRLYIPPPVAAELPLIVQFVSVASPP